MVGWQAVTQPHGYVQRRVVISGFESSTHTCQCSTDGPNRREVLSDRLLESGQNAEAVGRILHVHSKTLRRWVKAFASGGEEALTNFNYVGGDRWMSDEQLQLFTTWLDTDVRSTAEAIAWVEQQFGLSYSDSGMRKLLGRLDYHYKQPAVLPAKADSEAQAAWLETYTAKRGR